MLMLMEWQFSLARKLLMLISACLCLHCAYTYDYACAYTPSEPGFNPFAPGDFAQKRVLKLVEWFSGHCRTIKS